METPLSIKDEAFDFTIANPEKSCSECYIAGRLASEKNPDNQTPNQ